jgi:hypothetical protein
MGCEEESVIEVPTRQIVAILDDGKRRAAQITSISKPTVRINTYPVGCRPEHNRAYVIPPGSNNWYLPQELSSRTGASPEEQTEFIIQNFVKKIYSDALSVIAASGYYRNIVVSNNDAIPGSLKPYGPNNHNVFTLMEQFMNDPERLDWDTTMPIKNPKASMTDLFVCEDIHKQTIDARLTNQCLIQTNLHKLPELNQTDNLEYHGHCGESELYALLLSNPSKGGFGMKLLSDKYKLCFGVDKNLDAFHIWLDQVNLYDMDGTCASMKVACAGLDNNGVILGAV